jgi:cytochrome c oxidase assembly factor CtaG
MAFGSMLVEEFRANHALLQASILACNIMVWFQLLVLVPHRRRERPNTLRGWFIYLAAGLLHPDGRWVLALSKNYPHQQEWDRMEIRLAELRFS